MLNTSCKDNCKIQKIKCLTSCKRGFLRRLSKENFLTCFDKCSNSASVCSHRCDCMALVERERKGCDRACDLHPFTESFDLSHCYKECKYDFEWGQKMCDGGSIVLHKDPETTLTWSFSSTILDNLHRQEIQRWVALTPVHNPGKSPVMIRIDKGNFQFHVSDWIKAFAL